MKMLDAIRAMLNGQIPPPPVAQLIGFRLTRIEPGIAVVELDAEKRHANPMGTLHGGILCDIADAAMGMAHASLLDEGESFTTLELKINYLKPVWNAALTATGKMLKQGKTVCLVECEIMDRDGNLVAKASSTTMTLRGDRARGR